MLKPVFIYLSSFLFCLIAHAQSKVLFYDSTLNEPIRNVCIYNTQKELISISNEHGEIILNELTPFPVFAKEGSFEVKSIHQWKDTIILIPKYQEIQEVTIKPTDYTDFYISLIAASSKTINQKTDDIICGDYFEFVLIKDLNTLDSVYIQKSCNLTLEQFKNKKNVNYRILPSNGKKKFYQSYSNSDTIQLEKFANIIPALNSLLEFDLTETKKYDLKFENNQVNRNANGYVKKLLINKTEKYHKENFLLEYRSDTLLHWEKKYTHFCDANSNSKISMCYSEISYQIDFSCSPAYEFNNITTGAKIVYNFDGKKYEVYLCKGFIKNENMSPNNAKPIETIEKYFDYIPYQKSEAILRFYNFNDN